MPTQAEATRAYIGLGANLGDARATLRDAVHRLAQLPATTVVHVSQTWRSAPVDATGPDFYNAVAAVDTRLDAEALLAALHAIEAAHGRERPYRNAPRTLDLDLLLYGQATVHTAQLTLPHPRMHLRRFVLGPLLELAPHIAIPGIGPADAALAAIADQSAEPA
jgi:2-amino-4-hydroxy-6-hydroxymethyldihydropteridine diphosphokinase